jgi:hypothetical protein
VRFADHTHIMQRTIQRNEKRESGGTNERLRLLNTLLSDDKIARIKSNDLELGVEQINKAKTKRERIYIELKRK